MSEPRDFPQPRPHPNTLPCTDCGHVWFEGERRHQYVTADGAITIEEDGEPVCQLCHVKRQRHIDGGEGGVRYW